MDADVLIPKNFVKKIKLDFKKHQKITGVTVYLNFYDSLFLKRTKFYFYVYMWIAKIIIGHYIFGGPAYAVSRKFWEKVKGEVCLDDKKVHEDIDLSIHIGKRGQILFDQSLVVYASGRRINNNPLSFFIEYPLRILKMLRSH